MSNSAPMTPRQVYLQNRQRRQNKVFAIVTAGLMIALICALVGMSGLITLPFANEFSQKEHYAAPGDIPCPTEGALPTAPASVQVQILNGTTRPGIAGSATKILESLGYQVTPPENAQRDYPGSVEISSGPLGVDAAWTLARIFPKARVTLTEATDARVSVTLGSFYDNPIEADEAKRDSENTDPLDGGEKCLAVNPDLLEELRNGVDEAASGAQSDQTQSGEGQSAQ